MFKFNKKKVEQESLLRARTRALRNAEDEIENLRHLRLQDEHNSIVIIKENSKMHELLRDIADRTVTCPLGSEKIVLDKIKELAREYQSKN